MSSNYQLATLPSRLGAVLLDFICLLLLTIPLSPIISHFNIEPDGLLYWPVCILLVCIVDKVNNGQSIGKKYLKIKVVDEMTLGNPKVSQKIIRNLFRVLGILDVVFILGKKQKRLGDIAGKTIVINEL